MLQVDAACCTSTATCSLLHFYSYKHFVFLPLLVTWNWETWSSYAFLFEIWVTQSIGCTCVHVLWSPHAGDHWDATDVTTGWLKLTLLFSQWQHSWVIKWTDNWVIRKSYQVGILDLENEYTTLPLPIYEKFCRNIHLPLNFYTFVSHCRDYRMMVVEQNHL